MAVERQIELGRRYHRKKKMAKLKAILDTTTGAERDKVIYKIRRLSPWWTEVTGERVPAEQGPASKSNDIKIR